MAAAPPRGWSRGGGRAPSRGSRPERRELRLLHGRGGRGSPGAGQGARAAARARERSARGPAESRLRGAGLRAEVAPGWKPGAGARGRDSGSCRRAGRGRLARPLTQPRSPAWPAEARNGGAGHLGTGGTRAGRRWADPGCGPWGASGPPGPRRGEQGPLARRGPRQPGGSASEDRLEEQVPAAPVVARPQQRRFLESQITGKSKLPGAIFNHLLLRLLARILHSPVTTPSCKSAPQPGPRGRMKKWTLTAAGASPRTLPLCSSACTGLGVRRLTTNSRGAMAPFEGATTPPWERGTNCNQGCS
ncbi:collagen, type I, alpha 1a isoform X1 [Oryctolagus cuniculus]|uniref:collagen, type I, alpha 1a isoform X1 n=1 Tax=Oryctolagus cuniculus TaxID=9986 RepID=UPI003879C565